MGYARMINTPLDREQLTEFETVQRYHGINTIADVVRFLIRKEYRVITDHLQQPAPAPAGGNGGKE